MTDLLFFVGVHQVSDAHQVDYACVSLNRVVGRKSAFRPAKKGTLFDSGAFTTINRDGEYRESPEGFAARAASWVRRTPRTMGVVSQDYMCEPAVLRITGLTVADHQRLTIERYDAILAAWRAIFGRQLAADEHGPHAPPIIPVLQGWTVEDYLSHIDQYGERLTPGTWVGVGSVCKRQGSVAVIEDILTAIKRRRPDLRLHGFRREADGAAKPAGAPAAVHRRQHGVELRRPQSRPGRQQHQGGHRLRGAGAVAAKRARAIPLGLRRMTHHGTPIEH